MPPRWLACGLALALFVPLGRARADSAHGLGPDAQLTGGVGVGLGGALDNHFLARVRAGVLYAHRPWIANLGVTGHLGALAGYGVGGELELNFGRGLFAHLGAARIDGGAWLGHAGVGFMVFGLEWQHRFDSGRPSDALLLCVRMPLGIWWLRERQEDARAATLAEAERTPARMRSPPPQPSAAAPAAPPEATPAAPAPEDPELARALLEARNASERGDQAGAAEAFARAYALRPDPRTALQLAAAEESLGKWRAASGDLTRALASSGLSEAEQAAAAQRLAALKARMPQLRIVLEHAAGDEEVVIDGVPEASALAGYDVALDPGPHSVEIRRRSDVLSRREISVTEGALTRLLIDLAAP